jgi:hypothetical protein
MSEPNYRQLSNKQRKQHYVTVLVERLAGKDYKAIAASLQMTEESVRRDLDYVARNWSSLLSPVGSGSRPKVSQVSSFEKLKVRAECRECNAQIAAGADRLVVTAVELVDESHDFDEVSVHNGTVVDVGGSYNTSVGRIRCHHYCEQCSESLDEFRISNPAFLKAGSVDAAQLEIGSVEKCEPGVQHYSTPGQSGEDVQKKRLDAFLKDTSSRGMRPEMRTAARLWVDGSSQSGIARKLNKDQSTICRMIKGAQAMAYASR